MPILRLKKYLGIREIGENLDFSRQDVSYFDFSNFSILPTNINKFQPIVTILESGWIIDGRFVITDDGSVIGEGFNWSEAGIGVVIIAQNKKLKVKENSNTLSIKGFSNDEGPQSVIREIDNDEIANSIFVSGFNNLSHFMMEIAPKTILVPLILPKYPSINKSIILSDLVPKKWIDYCLNTASSIDKSNFDLSIKQINSDKAIRFKNILVISSTSYKDSENKINMSVNQAKFFSMQMCKNAFSTTDGKPYIIYLSRKNAAHRKTLNQENLIVIIKKIFPNFNLIVEDEIHKLSMEDQAKLIYNAKLVIEEGGGSTGFVSNLIGNNSVYVTIQTAQRQLDAAKLYLAGLNKYAAWIFGEPVGELTESLVVDNDIIVDESKFERLMIQVSLFVLGKFPMPIIGDKIK